VTFGSQDMMACHNFLDFLIVLITHALVFINLLVLIGVFPLIDLLRSNIPSSVLKNISHLLVKLNVVLLDLKIANFSQIICPAWRC